MGPKIEHLINQIFKQLSFHQNQPCITLGGFGYVTMDAGIPNTSTKSTRDIAVLQPSDQINSRSLSQFSTFLKKLCHLLPFLALQRQFSVS